MTPVLRMALAFCVAGAVGLAGCASGGGSGGDFVAPGFDPASVASVHLDTPIQISLGGQPDGATARVVEQEIREFLAGERGWAFARNAGSADVVVRLEVTDWESATTGSRVGGVLELVRPADGTVVYRSTAVFPSRFGAPAPGQPRDLLPALFRDLFPE